MRDLAGWFGVDGWIRVENEEIPSVTEEVKKEEDFEEEEEEVKGPVNTPEP